MTRQELRRLARIGAESQLWQLRGEIEAIYRAFPNLRSGKQRVSSATQPSEAPSSQAGFLDELRVKHETAHTRAYWYGC
jgi:hypothetical protein